MQDLSGARRVPEFRVGLIKGPLASLSRWSLDNSTVRARIRRKRAGKRRAKAASKHRGRILAGTPRWDSPPDVLEPRVRSPPRCPRRPLPTARRTPGRRRRGSEEKAARSRDGGRGAFEDAKSKQGTQNANRLPSRTSGASLCRLGHRFVHLVCADGPSEPRTEPGRQQPIANGTHLRERPLPPPASSSAPPPRCPRQGPPRGSPARVSSDSPPSTPSCSSSDSPMRRL